MAYGRRQSGKSEIGHPNHYLGGNRSGNNPVQLCGFEYHFEVFEFVAGVWYNNKKEDVILSEPFGFVQGKLHESKNPLNFVIIPYTRDPSAYGLRMTKFKIFNVCKLEIRN